MSYDRYNTLNIVYIFYRISASIEQCWCNLQYRILTLSYCYYNIIIIFIMIQFMSGVGDRCTADLMSNSTWGQIVFPRVHTTGRIMISSELTGLNVLLLYNVLLLLLYHYNNTRCMILLILL